MDYKIYELDSTSGLFPKEIGGSDFYRIVLLEPTPVYLWETFESMEAAEKVINDFGESNKEYTILPVVTKQFRIK
jgi:hypothetical protein